MKLVPGRIVASQILSVIGLYLGFVSLWPKIESLYEFGLIGSKLSFLHLIAVPAALSSLVLLLSYSLKSWKEVGRRRVIIALILSVLSIVVSVSGAWAMFVALP